MRTDMQDKADIWPLAFKGLGATIRIIVICSALSAVISVYADWSHAALSITLIPNLLFSSLVEFALVNAMLGRPVMGGAGGGARFQRFLVAYLLISGLPMLIGAIYGIAFSTLEAGLFFVAVPLSILSYGFLGTVFPAILDGEPNDMAAALRRGRRQFGFVLPRVLGVTVVTFAAALLLFFAFNQASGALVLSVTEGRITTTGVVYEFVLQLMGNAFWSFAIATLVVAYHRENPARIFE